MAMKRTGIHPDRALTALKVNSLKEPGRYADGNGLYLVVEQTGAKRWILRTTVKRKRCDIGLGGARDVSLAEVREKAAELRKIAKAGGDPLAERRNRTSIPTFAEAAALVYEQHRTPGKTGSTRPSGSQPSKGMLSPRSATCGSTRSSSPRFWPCCRRFGRRSPKPQAG